MPDLFGCCSSYVECSDSRSCLHKSEPDYAGCMYRKNLEKGRIFYGKNANIRVETESMNSRELQQEIEKIKEIEEREDEHISKEYLQPETIQEKPKIIPNWMKPEYNIYLNCYNQSFKLCVRNKVRLSYGLKEESFTKLKNLFDALSIPYTTELSESEQEVKEKQICNYRVIIEAGEDKYNVLNYNSLLIPEKIARGIQKAFEAKGIPASIEQYGRYSAVEIPPWNQRVEIKAVSTEPIFEPAIEPEPESKQKEVVFEQASIFDIIGA